MNILFIASSYPRYPQDYAGKFVYEMAELLGKRGHHTHVLTWRSLDVDHTWTPPFHTHTHVSYAPADLELLFYRAGTPENLTSTPILASLIPPAILKMLWTTLIHAPRFDLIVGHWAVPGGFLARLIGALLGIPSVVITHSGGVHLLQTLSNSFSTPLASFLSRGPISFVSHEQKERLAKLSPLAHRGVVLPMGFAPPTGEDDPERGAWCCLGRLVPIKGVDDVIQAWILAGCPGHHLHIMGDGPERPILEKKYQNLTDRVIFHGTVVGEERDAILRTCAFSVFGSKVLEDARQEGWPVSVMECASAGAIPLIAQMPGCEALLADAQYQQLPDRDLEGWANVMQKASDLSQARQDALRHESRTRVQQWSWEVLIPRWEAFLKQACMR